MHDTDWLDARAARRAFERAARSGSRVDIDAALEREVERRMAERLDYLRHVPRRILDAGCGRGHGLALLRRRYRNSQLLGVDFAQGMAHASRVDESLFSRARRLFPGRASHWVCADFVRLPFAQSSIDMVWSNLALAWAPDPLAALGEFHRVLVAGGLLMFSTYGPDTLKELKASFGGEGARRIHPFIDMHDLGDMLIASGFVTPVMDMEIITLTYADVGALARDLRASGQTGARLARPKTLTGRGAWQRMASAYESWRKDGRIPATIEIVYGHAWKGEPRIAVDKIADGRQIVKFDFNSRKPR